ncbi:uncharacterized protein [Mytilus edulis]|uniref:uncharacterized protein n=1 Tax=Mytilus edulis TaxID=6550 RepID=UPI0039F07730
MRSTGKLCIQKIKGMAEKLDCSIDRVKMWIGNKNARERSVGTIDYSKKKTATKRGPSAYNIVTGDIPRGNMTGSEYLRKAAEVWRGASAEQKQLATEKAKKIKMDPLQNMDSEQAINHHLKIISKSCDIIASLGLQVGGVCVTKDKVPSYFGTPKAMSFFKDNIIEIVDSLTGEEQTIKSEKPKRLALKEEVRKVFNASFEKCGMKKVPYKALSLGQISFSVSGLPEGITFKEPGSYSTSTMESILSRKDQIHVAKISREETIEEKVIANKGNKSIGSQSEKVKANKENECIDSQSEKVIANKGNENIGSQSGTTVQQTDSEGSIQGSLQAC